MGCSVSAIVRLYSEAGIISGKAGLSSFGMQHFCYCVMV